MAFKELKIIDSVIRAIEERGYKKPTLIQSKAIPHILNRKDMLVRASTGVGKTASYAVPIIHLIQKIDGRNEDAPVLRVIVLAPDGVSLGKIGENFDVYGKYTKVKHAVLSKTELAEEDQTLLKGGVHVLAATPEVFLSLKQKSIINLEEVKMVVVDELDKISDLGKLDQTKELYGMLPDKKQSLIYSAKLEGSAKEFSMDILTDPKKIEIKPKNKGGKSRNDRRDKKKDGGKGPTNQKKSNNKSKKKGKGRSRRNTDMSDKLKAKFLWPLE